MTTTAEVLLRSELERVDRPVDPKDTDLVILSGLTPQYDAEVRMIESSSAWPTREWIEHAVIKQPERLDYEKSPVEGRAVLSTRGHRSYDNPPIRCPPLLPHRTLCLAMPEIPDHPA